MHYEIMKGAMLYVDAGKGHYTPAKALADNFLKAGHEAIVENLFNTFDSAFWNVMTKYSWRLMLHFPRLEPFLTNSIDSRFNAFLMKRVVELEKHMTCGDTPEDVIINLKDALKAYVMTSLANNMEIAEPLKMADFKGNITYRTTGEKHYHLAKAAKMLDVSINSLIDSAVDAKLKEIA